MSSENLSSDKPLHLTQRPRRLRRTETLRKMVRETILTVDDLIYPMFVMEGESIKIEIASMPGCYRFSLDLLLEEITVVSQLGINAIACSQLFPKNKRTIQVQKATTQRDWYRKPSKPLKKQFQKSS